MMERYRIPDPPTDLRARVLGAARRAESRRFWRPALLIAAAALVSWAALLAVTWPRPPARRPVALPDLPPEFRVLVARHHGPEAPLAFSHDWREVIP